jgi:hypothetical protein
MYSLPFEIAQAQRLDVNQTQLEPNGRFPKAIRFYCAKDYNRNECSNHILTLRHELARYPIDQLGPWTFVLGTSKGWDDLAHSLRIDPRSPAFTAIDSQITVFEEALFSPIANRVTELIRDFGTTGDALLQLAVSHELGHALCKEGNEYQADAYGLALRRGQKPACKQSQLPPI